MRYRKASNVHEKTIGEAFFLFSTRGGYYGFDGVGRDIWALLVAGRDVEEVIDEIAAAYTVDADVVRADVDELVRDLCDQALVEARPPD